MPRRTIHSIDPYAPGGIDELLNFHRAQWGDMQMNANAGGGEGGESGDPSGTPESGETSPAANPPATPPAPKPADSPTAPEWDGKVESLPQGAQKMIADLRKGEGDERVAKKTLDQLMAVLNPDKKGEKPDAEALTKQLSEQATAAKQAQLELAVYRASGKHNADPDALLDSRAFLAKIADIDPTKTADVEKAIEDAVKNNPKLKSARVSGSSTADGAGGSGEPKPKTKSLDSAIGAHYSK